LDAFEIADIEEHLKAETCAPTDRNMGAEASKDVSFVENIGKR
jgi:hypothetical protein